MRWRTPAERQLQRVDDAWVMREVTEGSVRLPSLEIERSFGEIHDLEGVRR